jgi:hypothetical protein
MPAPETGVTQWLLQWGKGNAGRVSANQEAVALSQRRLEVVRMLPDTDDADRDR